MGTLYLWKGGNGTLSAAADWFVGSGTAAAAPGTADTADLDSGAAGLVLAAGGLDVASLSIRGGIMLSGAVAAGTLAESGTLVLAQGATLDAATASVAGTLAAEDASLAVTGTLAVTGAAEALDGGSIATAMLALAGGTIALDALSSVAIGSGATAGAGTLAIAGTAALAGSGAVQAGGDTIALAGTISATGALALFGSIAGTGTLAIGGGATMFVAGTLGPGLDVVFEGSAGTLELYGLAAGGDTLTGFGTSDVLAIEADSIAAATWASGVLTLTDASGAAMTLDLPDGGGLTYDTATFLPIPDGAGGSRILVGPAPTTAPNGNIVFTVPAGTEDVFAGAYGNVPEMVIAGLVTALQHTAVSMTIVQGSGTLLALGATGLITTPGAVVTDASALFAAVGASASAIVRTTLQLAGTFAGAGGGLASAGTVELEGGVLTLDATSYMQLGSGALERGSIDLPSGNTLAGYGRILAPLDDEGVLVAQGGALFLGAAASGHGVVQIGTGATLETLASLALPVTFGAGTTLDVLAGPSLVTGTLSGFAAGDAIDIAGTRIDSATWSGGTLALIAGGTTAGTLLLAGSFSGQSWQTRPDGTGGTLVTLGTSEATTLTVAATLAVTSDLAAPAATVESGALLAMRGGTLSAGTLALASGGAATGTGEIDATVADAGTLAASGGVLIVEGGIGGSGEIAVGAFATLFADAGFAAGATLTFEGAGGMLAVAGGPSAAPALIQGFTSGEGIDLIGTPVASASWSGGGGLGTLALIGTGGEIGTLVLAGSYATAGFLPVPDGSGGSVIELVPCFVAGTRIATPGGERPVEALRPGDAVLTQAGMRRLRWVGRRSCDAGAAPEARPVRIAAGALARLAGAGRPARDLRLSPQHAVLLGGMLVPAVALAGAPGIAREGGGVVDYHHIGLDEPGLVWAEGVPTETFLPLADAVRFEAEWGARPLPALPCAPRVEGGVALLRLRRRLARPARAGPPGALRGHLERATDLGGTVRLEGWALDTAAPVRLTVLRDGLRIGGVVANRWRPDLDRAGLGGGCCAFILDVPGPPGGFALRRRPDGMPLAAAP